MKMQGNILVIVAAMVSLSTLAGEQEGIKLGGMTFHPFVAGEMMYDDNVFGSVSELEDTYLQYSAGAKLKRETDSFQFDSSAWFSQRFYNEYEQKDGERWGVAGMVRNESDKSFGTLMLNARQVDDHDEVPAYGSVPAGFEGAVDVVFDRTGGDERRRIYDALTGGGYELSDAVSLMGGYKFYAVDYFEGGSAFKNWNEHILGAELSFKATDKAVFFLNALGGIQDGDGAPNGEQAELFTGRVGIKNSLTDKSTARFALGATHYSSYINEYTRPSFEGNLLWAATEKVTFFIKGRNEIQPVGNGTNTKISNRALTGANYSFNQVLSMVLSGGLVYEKSLDTIAGEKPEKTIGIGTFRVNVNPVAGLDLFAQIEFSDVQQDVAGDYQRMRSSLGAGYQF